jgi:hypothetical protein
VTKEEWRLATRRFWPPDWDDADFDEFWEAFIAMKFRRTLH